MNGPVDPFEVQPQPLCEFLIDADRGSQRAGEPAVGGRALEACEPPAGVDAAPRCLSSGRENSLARHETNQLGLRRFAAATSARPHHLVAHAALGSPSSSDGISVTAT